MHNQYKDYDRYGFMPLVSVAGELVSGRVLYDTYDKAFDAAVGIVDAEAREGASLYVRIIFAGELQHNIDILYTVYESYDISYSE